MCYWNKLCLPLVIPHCTIFCVKFSISSTEWVIDYDWKVLLNEKPQFYFWTSIYKFSVLFTCYIAYSSFDMCHGIYNLTRAIAWGISHFRSELNSWWDFLTLVWPLSDFAKIITKHNWLKIVILLNWNQPNTIEMVICSNSLYYNEMQWLIPTQKVLYFQPSKVKLVSRL